MEFHTMSDIYGADSAVADATEVIVDHVFPGPKGPG